MSEVFGPVNSTFSRFCIHRAESPIVAASGCPSTSFSPAPSVAVSRFRASKILRLGLVVRGGRLRAKNVLTMRGTLRAFDDVSACADGFLLREGKPRSVEWKPKELETFPLDGPDSLHGTDKFEFLGTLRPLYAQEVQRRALTDLSRIGLPVAPALCINGTANVWIRKKNSKNPRERITMESSAVVSIIPSREGQSIEHRVLFQRRFVHELTLIAKSSKHENAKQPHWAQARSSCWGTRSPPL